MSTTPAVRHGQRTSKISLTSAASSTHASTQACRVQSFDRLAQRMYDVQHLSSTRSVLALKISRISATSSRSRSSLLKCSLPCGFAFFPFHRCMWCVAWQGALSFQKGPAVPQGSLSFSERAMGARERGEGSLNFSERARPSGE